MQEKEARAEPWAPVLLRGTGGGARRGDGRRKRMLFNSDLGIGGAAPAMRLGPTQGYRNSTHDGARRRLYFHGQHGGLILMNLPGQRRIAVRLRLQGRRGAAVRDLHVLGLHDDAYLLVSCAG